MGIRVLESHQRILFKVGLGKALVTCITVKEDSVPYVNDDQFRASLAMLHRIHLATSALIARFALEHADAQAWKIERKKE